MSSALLVLLLLLVIHFSPLNAFPTYGKNARVRVAYWPAYSSFPASSIDAKLFTHLNYAFAQLDSTTNQVVADDAARLASFPSIVKGSNPAVRALISVGGGGADPKPFSAMASNASSRSTFIQSSILLARQNKFDGLDLDWEFPQSQQDMDNLGVLFAEWRTALQAESRRSGLPRLLLTAAVYYSATVRNVGAGTYPTSSINANLDWVSMMAFDYHGAWDPTVTGAHTALYDPKSQVNTNAGVNRWIEAGLKPEKGVLGLAMYGHSWILKDPSSKAGIGAPAVSAGPGDGTPLFVDIMSMVAANANATVVYDNTTVTAYVQIGSLWIGFDSPRSIHNKVMFLVGKKLRGYFFWTASFDTSTSLLSKTAAAALGFF